MKGNKTYETIADYDVILLNTEIPDITASFVHDHWYLSGKQPGSEHPLLCIHVKNVERWVEDGGEYKSRLAYNLTPNSIVFDVGGYIGDWASSIYSKHNCFVYVFEPVIKFFETCKDRFDGNDKLVLFNIGLGASTRDIEIATLGDASSLYLECDNMQMTRIVNICEFMDNHEIEIVDLLKLNIEGGEYEILPWLLETGYIKRIRNVQVQFHYFIEDATENMESIRSLLRKTHRPTYMYDYVWENWELIDDND